MLASGLVKGLFYFLNLVRQTLAQVTYTWGTSTAAK